MEENVAKLVRAIATHGVGNEQGRRGVPVQDLCSELGIGVAALRDIVELNWPLFDSVQTRKTMAGLVAIGLSARGRQAAHDLEISIASPVLDAESVRNHLSSVEDGHGSLSSEQLVSALGIGPVRVRDAVDVLEESGEAEAQHMLGGRFHVSLTAKGRAETNRAALNSFPGKDRAREEVGAVDPEDYRFKLETRLGEGTAGEVWRAHDVVLNRKVAIKFVTATNAGNDALAHARALARVSHPNIVAVFEITHLPHPKSGALSSVVVMELVEGTPLAERIGPSMSRDEMRRAGHALIDALEAYHLAGLAHLDVHDGNVMVSAAAVKMLDPLYYETDLFRSTATREKQQARDVREARGVLVQLVHGGAIPLDAANTFERLTAKPSLALLRAELDKATALNDLQPSARSTTLPMHVGAAREQALHGVYKRLRQVHKTTLALIHLVQSDGPGEQAKADGDKRRMLEHDSAWKDLQEFHLANGLYLGAGLDRRVNEYMAGVIKAVAQWNAGRHPRGNVYDWSDAFNGLKALGETTLEQIFDEIREILGIRDAPGT